MSPCCKPMAVITIGNSMPEIAAVAARCREFGRLAGLDADALVDLQLALDEILSNAIRHALPDTDSRTIDVHFLARDDAIEVTVEYEGVPFDPAEAPPPDRRSPLPERRVGGLGVHFARELLDEMQYRRIGKLNRMTLIRKLPRPAGSDADGTR